MIVSDFVSGQLAYFFGRIPSFDWKWKILIVNKSFFTSIYVSFDKSQIVKGEFNSCLSISN